MDVEVKVQMEMWVQMNPEERVLYLHREDGTMETVKLTRKEVEALDVFGIPQCS